MCGRWTKPEKQISVFKQKRTDACGRGLRIEKCLLTQLVRIAVVKGSYPGKPEIFRLSFHNCINCLFLCVDLLCIIFFIPRFKCTKFINSSFFLTQLLTVHSLFQMKANSHEIKFQRVISRFRNRKGNWSSFVNLLHNRWIVHSPLFFRKMVEIKRYVSVSVSVTVTGGHSSLPHLNKAPTPHSHFGTFETKMAAFNAKRSIPAILWKNRGLCRNSLIKRKN